MTARRSAASRDREIRARRETALARPELRGQSTPGVGFRAAASPTAAPVKVLSPDLRALIDAAATRTGAR